jgi:hypothetical protein
MARSRPTTTGGRPKPTLKLVRRRARPRNEDNATQAPRGMPSRRLRSVALSEMSSDCRITLHVSGSPVTSNIHALINPSPISVQ